MAGPGGGRFCCFRSLGRVEEQQRQTRHRMDHLEKVGNMIRKLKSGEYRLYSRKKDEQTGKRKNLGTFTTREQAEKHERAVQYFKHAG
jgi:hypothetical protein